MDPVTAQDAKVFALFDELFELAAPARAARLETLGTQDPALHARLVRMLAAATDGTRKLAEPVIGQLQAFDLEATASLKTGAVVCGYQLLHELGRGGMSTVWLAERSDGIVKRRVALKLPLTALRTTLDIARFEQERDVLAALAHPHIARLYDAGVTADGQPFIVLEYVDGVPITSYCDTHKLGIRGRLELFLQVLAAVGHAHKHLTVHRDLKPSNILVDAEGQVKLLDFGIAKLLADPATGSAAPQTQLGTAALTPMYAAPEQIAQLPISTLTDIYVLGLVLHELLTGVLPHATSADTLPSLADILRTQMRGFNRPPSKAVLTESAARVRDLADAVHLRRSLKGDLDTIVQKTLQAEAERRYGSTEQLADDLRSFLEHRPITARPARFSYVAGLFLKRHRTATLVTAAGSLLLVVALSTALHQYLQSRANAARTIAVQRFMFTLINDAEPNEDQTRGTDWKQVFDKAVLRARERFGSQPQLLGEVLGEIGRTYTRINERASSEQTLREALQLLTATAPADDQALNKARAHLSSIAENRSDFTRARELATLARDSCTRHDEDCTKARAYANTVLSRVYSHDGNPAQSLGAMRQSVRDFSEAFGESDPDTGIAWSNLAMLARNYGILQEASAAMQRATAIANGQVLRTSDRRLILRSSATIELDLGHYAAARVQLAELLDTSTSADDRTTLLRLLAQVAQEQGLPSEALDLAQQAAAANTRQSNMEFFFAVLAQARASALLGQHDQARLGMQTVLSRLTDLGLKPDSSTMLRVRRATAEVQLRIGDVEQALLELDTLIARLRALPWSADIELGQALDLKGCALRSLGRHAEATAAHELARVHLQKQLASDHPFLLRNTLYQEAAAGRWERFQSQAQQLGKTLVPNSIWKKLLDAAGTSLECRSGSSRPCVIVL